jgi:hypothetical protein
MVVKWWGRVVKWLNVLKYPHPVPPGGGIVVGPYYRRAV